ncbi:hypothetical protein PWG15_30135 (plasmid) [Ensifer adhaerens]|nr:hypothetical protein [Ensifer adhaerens]WDZ79695.1 hypothetical protein PWG15_30135 [Ensifer adhaerens]
MRMLDGLKAEDNVVDRKVRAAGVRMLDFEMLRHAARHDGDTSQGSILP